MNSKCAHVGQVQIHPNSRLLSKGCGAGLLPLPPLFPWCQGVTGMTLLSRESPQRPAHSKPSVSAGHSCHYYMLSTLTCAAFSQIVTAFSLRGSVMILSAEDFFIWWYVDMCSAL